MTLYIRSVRADEGDALEEGLEPPAVDQQRDRRALPRAHHHDR
jgi:hypothetical protein